MIQLVDSYAPWFVDMLDLGGSVMILILFIATLMWSLIFERIYFLLIACPRVLSNAQDYWQQREDHQSWYAQKFRERIMLHVNWQLDSHISAIKVLIIVCPLLGLLGTVVGMLEVFDSMGATGSNNPRSTASGVSKATVSTMAGMVMAISGLLAMSLIERRIRHAKSNIHQQLSYDNQRG